MHDTLNISQRKEELDRAFSSLCNNTMVYFKLLNDLQKPAARSTWVERYTKRAQICAELYHKNHANVMKVARLCARNYQEDLKDFRPDLKATDLEALGEHNLTCYRFLQLHQYPYFRNLHETLPFEMELVCKHYDKDIRRLMPQSEVAFIFYSTYMESLAQIALLNDADAARKMSGLAIKMLSFEKQYATFSCDKLRLRFLHAYKVLLYVDFIIDGGIDPETAIHAWKRYKKFRATLPKDMLIQDPELQADMQRTRFYCDGFITALGFTYMHDAKNYASSYKEWLDNELKEFVIQYGKPKPNSYMLYCTAQWLLGSMTVDEAEQKAMEFYNRLKWKPEKKYDTNEVLSIIYLIRNVLFLVAKSKQPVEVKQMRILKGLEIAHQALKQQCEQYFNYELTHAAYALLCDKHLNQFLTTEQRRYNLMSTYRCMQPLYYAHSCMVARISEEILDAVLRYEPELLVGYLGTKSTQEVNDRAHEFYDYLTNAALLHDIGMLSIAPVANNDYIPCSPHEQALLNQHPERAKMFLSLDPSFARYEDVALGHHRSYNGKKGYPEEFAVSKSPYRIFIDMVHIADSIECTFHNVGQCHDRESEFSPLFDQFFAQGGKEFNPKLMTLMRKHSEVYRNVSELVRTGWKNTFFDVFLDYFGRR